MMIAAIDVDYRDDRGQAAAVLFRNWTDAEATGVFKSITSHIAPYEPGAFYKRELPCLLDVINQIPHALRYIIIDGFVWLDDHFKPGLGAHLYDALERNIPVIGVAKTNFIGAHAAARILRGTSRQPLFVTAAGLPVQLAAAEILSMHGLHRIPTLLHLADQECRHWDEDQSKEEE